MEPARPHTGRSQKESEVKRMSNRLQCDFSTKTILDLRSLMENGHLNLEPGFQRKSVWKKTNRERFIKSVLEGFPVPSIFLYSRTDEDGMPVYDVLDGKQRLETLFKFMRVGRFRSESFEVACALGDDEEEYLYNWKALEKHEHSASFLMYKLQVAEVKGDFSDIVELFVRINSTGMPLTSSEKRNAKFYTSPMLLEAKKLAKSQQASLLKQGVVSESSIARMKDVELVSELLTSIISNGPIDRKQAVDRAVGNTDLHARTLAKSKREYMAAANQLKRTFPDLHSTRFRNSAEFYTLFLLVWEWQQERLVLTDSKRNKVAMKVLMDFSNGVDATRQRQKGFEGISSGQRLYAEYLLLVQQGTDKLGSRTQRLHLLRGLFQGLFARKDEQRIFSAEQRRLLWNSDEKKQCAECSVKLDWTNFEVDHVEPHSRGGKTNAKNAALLCRSCNASKGAGRKKKPVAKQRKRTK